jgi:hypothetical protein
MSRLTRTRAFVAGALFLALARCTAPLDGDVAADPEALRGPGKMCGGFAGFTCEPGLSCYYAPGSCGAGDRAGTCRRRPEVCTFLYQPVCGCDRRTYPNSCEAARAGESVAHRGACGASEEQPASAEGAPAE